jgi:hypothetical protein
MTLTQLVRKLKRDGILGDFVRVRRDGALLIRVRGSKDGYANGNMLPAILHAYVKETGVKVHSAVNSEAR